LDVGHNQLGDEGAQILARNKTLASLNVSNNRIGYEGAEALTQNTALTTLNVEINQIGDEGAIALAHNRTLTSLNIEHNQLGTRRVGVEYYTLVSNQTDKICSLIKRRIEHNRKTVVALYVFATIEKYMNTPKLPELPLEMLYQIATFLVPEKTAFKLKAFADPRFFMRQIRTNNHLSPVIEADEPQEAEEVTPLLSASESQEAEEATQANQRSYCVIS